MKKILKIVLITVVGFLTLFSLDRVYQKNYYKGVYESLSNVFLEMNYAEINSGILPGLADFSKAVDGSQSFRDPDWIIPIGLDAGLSENESLKVIVGFEETFIIEYQQLLSDGRYL
ncbi:TipC family immunity protein, partial [Streptococcus taonis]